MDFLTAVKVKNYSGQPVTVAQTKFDGYYAEVYKSKSIPEGIFVCTKKQNVNLWPKLKKNQHIRSQLEGLPLETCLRCELHAFDVPATSVPTLINNADERLLLSPFCIEKWNGIPKNQLDLDFEEQRSLLVDCGFIVPQLRILSGVPESLLDEDVEVLKADAEDLGREGWVVKDIPGGTGWKIKPQKTVDAFVTEYTVSDSDSFAGGLKAVTIAVWEPVDDVTTKQTVIASVGSGFDAKYRMSVKLSSLIGKIGEFKYQDIGAKGRLKFPRFLRWRDGEKRSLDCTMDQLK